MTRPVIVGITGASGAAYGLALLDLLDRLQVEAHLIVTEPGAQVLEHETGLTLEQAAARASRCWRVDDLFAPPASGTFLTTGMVVAPCSIRTLSAVACAHSGNLLERAADVTLKQRRPLVLMVRESPLHVGHLRLMTQAAEAGATIMPPVPAFYHRPASVEAMVEATAARALDLLGLEHDLVARWGEGERRT
jgi:4-hydroxy-3-polyprenylbenzoate decarboxylase